MSRFHTLVCAAAAATFSAGSAAWDSQLLPKNPTTGQYAAAPVSFGGRTWRLLDYSYSGYRLGTQPLATGIPCNSVSIAGIGDIANELQAAINTVGSAGGGTVLIPAGHFTVSHSVGVPFDNVSIAGAGSGLTFLAIPASYDPASDTDEGVFTFGKAIGSWNKAWFDRGDTLAMAAATINEGDAFVDVVDASLVTVGAWVSIGQYHGSALSQRNSGGAWKSYSGFPDGATADREASFVFLRQVTAKSGNRVTLDAPIPWKLDLANNPIGVRDAENPSWVRAHTNVGVAGVSIEFARNANGPSGRPAGVGVYFEGVREGWAWDVQVRNFARVGILMDSAARVTILDSAVYGAQDYGVDGFGYGIETRDSQNILVRRARAEDTRHGFISRSALTSMLVYSQDESAAARLSDDVHFALSQAVLWDAHKPTFGTGVQGFYRGTESAGAHETLGSGTYWKVQGDGYRGSWWGGSLQLNPSSDGYAIVVGPLGLETFDIGTSLGTNAQRIASSAGLQLATGLDTPGPGSRDQNVLYEGVDTAGLSPASLYTAQLNARLGSIPADFATACRAAPTKGAFTPATYTGSGVLVFDSDHLGFMPSIGGGCTGCEIDSTAQNRTAGGRDSFAIQMGATNFAIGADFRGPTLTTSQFQQLHFSIFPTQDGLQFRARLSQEDLPEGTYASRGDYIVSGLTAGQWNRVSIPIGSYTAGSFNSFEIRSNGSASTIPFWVDDVVLDQVAGAAPATACSDGIDNDNDGKVDLADAGCASAVDDDETEPVVAGPPAAGGLMPWALAIVGLLAFGARALRD